jgi:hypothetical protein
MTEESWEAFNNAVFFKPQTLVHKSKSSSSNVLIQKKPELGPDKDTSQYFDSSNNRSKSEKMIVRSDQLGEHFDTD